MKVAFSTFFYNEIINAAQQLVNNEVNTCLNAPFNGIHLSYTAPADEKKIIGQIKPSDLNLGNETNAGKIIFIVCESFLGKEIKE